MSDDNLKTLDYAPPPPVDRSAERGVYLLLRVIVAAFGALIFVSMLALFLETRGQTAASLSTRRTGAVVLGLIVGTLFVVPNRWTQHTALFWPRLVLHVGVCGLAIWDAVRSVVAAGAVNSSHITSLMFAMAGIALVAALIWSRRFGPRGT